ncbi:MAG: hypothetical protein E6J65_23410 [Deltaproteobacteria bacterium]|nr:MAG: hypothetical protein E6J65_23410 [Deltaproteobacteria bacterium]
MRALAPLITAVAAAVLAGETDPAGTVLLPLGTGQSAPVTAAPGANVLCDDPAVVAPDFAEDAGDFVLRGLTPGTTLCGVWLAGQKPGGLYRVVVTAKADDAGAKPDLAADTGPGDAETRQTGGTDTPTDDAGPKRSPTPEGDVTHRG